MVQHNFCAKFSADFLWFVRQHRAVKKCFILLIIEAVFNLLAWLMSATATKPMSLSSVLIGSNSQRMISTHFLIDLLAINIVAVTMALMVISLVIICMCLAWLILCIRSHWISIKQDLAFMTRRYKINVHDAYEQKKFSRRS